MKNRKGKGLLDIIDYFLVENKKEKTKENMRHYLVAIAQHAVNIVQGYEPGE